MTAITERFWIGKSDYDIPICWEAVTFAKYLEWVNDWVMFFPDEKEALTGEHESSDIEYPIKMLSFQTGIPLDILKQVSFDNLEIIKSTQQFWFDFEELNKPHINSIPTSLAESIDIDSARAQFMIEFVHGVSALGDKHFLNLAPDLIKNYFEVDILPEPVTKYYGLSTFFLLRSANTGLKNRHKYNLSRQVVTKLRQVSECLTVSV